MEENENETQTQSNGEANANSPTSGNETAALPAYVTALQDRLNQQDAVIKGLQKGSDKQIGQVRGDIKRILELQAEGKNEAQIKRELFLDAQMETQDTPVPNTIGTSGKDNSLDVDTTLTALQFPPNDPILASLKIKFVNDPNGLIKAAADYRLTLATSPNPSTAHLLSQNGGTTSEENKIGNITDNDTLYKMAAQSMVFSKKR